MINTRDYRSFLWQIDHFDLHFFCPTKIRNISVSNQCDLFQIIMKCQRSNQNRFLFQCAHLMSS